MWVLFLIFAFLAGLALPIQFSINAQLRTVVGSPLVAATISFIVGAITLFTVSLFKAGFSLNKGIASAPWW
ncbi:TPA: DMT family transporter, partial [Bacillus cereus]|nr:DMT family transporter [Bacillus cereus]